MKQISQAELYRVFRHIKTAYHIDRDGIEVTIATNDGVTEYGWQTGDNCYSGAAYFLPHWAVVTVYPRSSCKKLARDVQDQWADLISQ